MDRNEKKNSFRNVQNSRGNDKEAKKYKRAFHITLAVAVVLAASTGGLGFTTYRLSRDEAKNQESGTDPVVVENETVGDGTEAETTPESGKATTASDDTQSQESAEEPEGTVTPEVSVTTAPEENAAETIKVTVTNSLGSDINTIDIREAIYNDDSEGWKSDLWKGTLPLTADGSEKYSVKLDGLKEDNFDIRINGGKDDERFFRNLPLKSIKEIELKVDNDEQDGSGLPYTEYKENESGEVVSTLEEVKNRVNAGSSSKNTENSTGSESGTITD